MRYRRTPVVTFDEFLRVGYIDLLIRKPGVYSREIEDSRVVADFKIDEGGYGEYLAGLEVLGPVSALGIVKSTDLIRTYLPEELRENAVRKFCQLVDRMR